MKTIYLLISILMLNVQPLAAQNLFGFTEWVAGTIGNDNFAPLSSYDSRVWHLGPQGTSAVVWKSHDIEDGGDLCGGIKSSGTYSINSKKLYRICVWVKKDGPKNDYEILWGPNIYNNTTPQMINSSGISTNLFENIVLPESNKWYLLVGYVRGNNDAQTQIMGGVYDSMTGEKVKSVKDLKFKTTASQISFSIILNTNPGNPDPAHIAYFYNPRIEVVDGNEVSIAALLGRGNGIGSNFFTNNVGIKTNDTKGYTLAVNGNIRTKEIKVEAANWPDFVFKQDYNLRSLKEVKSYIDRNGHLPDVPNAINIEKNGADLGEMNKILLKKIEELTLHLIQKDKEVDELKALERRLKKVEAKVTSRRKRV